MLRWSPTHHQGRRQTAFRSRVGQLSSALGYLQLSLTQSRKRAGFRKDQVGGPRGCAQGSWFTCSQSATTTFNVFGKSPLSGIRDRRQRICASSTAMPQPGGEGRKFPAGNIYTCAGRARRKRGLTSRPARRGSAHCLV